MDGWMGSEEKGKGHDYLILKLGRPGKIYKVDIIVLFETNPQSFFGGMLQ